MSELMPFHIRIMSRLDKCRKTEWVVAKAKECSTYSDKPITGRSWCAHEMMRLRSKGYPFACVATRGNLVAVFQPENEGDRDLILSADWQQFASWESEA